ncbi:hypothetical protein [Arthrobacter sp. D5-1]|uniref:hypothetical protein n=1 Tax=Arthrobacter sp. D5-1 TaxID=1477518 RepID=UPI001A9820DD|nr:hypothetical protein [Arthrobacter sp. D5-1]QSZ47244.1 hypothetical protein AYX22_01635 [Arthrobacter sp. D5-1]
MEVFELETPGTWLTGIEDHSELGDVSSLLDLLIDCLNDAAVSLWLFDASQQLPLHESEAELEARRAAECSIYQELASKAEDIHAVIRDLLYTANVTAKRQRWVEGAVPHTYTRIQPFLHAQSFIYALDTIQKGLKLINRSRTATAEARSALGSFERAFPELVHVRDSAHHREDRARGKRRNSLIDLQADETPISSGGVALFGRTLVGNKYGGTLGDGRYGEVEISHQSLRIVQTIVQLVLNSYEWRGAKVHYPT